MHRVTTEGDIGQRVAIAAKSYEGAPYVAIAGQDSTMAVGLSPDHGFNCSGLVIRSVLDGYGLTLDDWRPDVRSADAMFKYSLGSAIVRHPLATNDELDKVHAGDVIGWTDGDYKTLIHCAIALGGVDSNGHVPYIHASRYSYGGNNGEGEVELEALKPNAYFRPYHLPLGRLAEVALRINL